MTTTPAPRADPRTDWPPTSQTTGPTGSRPGLLTLDELRALAVSGRITTVRLALPDMQGRLKGKDYPAGHFIQHIADSGAEFCGYLLATDVDMRPVDGYALASWQTGYGDLTVRPDLTTIRHLPWMPRTAMVLADAFHSEGLPVEVSPRRMLRRQLDQLAARGITGAVGLEAEFVLYRGTAAEAEQTGYRNLHPVTGHNIDYALDHPRPLRRFLRELPIALAGADLPLESVKTEGAAGQVEVTFRYGDPMKAADAHLLLKQAVKVVAERQEMAPTFMAAPATGVGSGLHVHLSLWREGEALFADVDGQLSPLAHQVIGGLLDAMPHLALLYAPTVNAYKRYAARSFAPTYLTWGYDNRTCAVRVVGHGDGLHLEVRFPGADANPYLALTAILAAAQHGIDHDLDPGKPYTGDAYQAPDETRIHPRALEEALECFDGVTLAAELLTDEVVRHYARAAEIEIETHRRHVTDLDRQRGFSRT